MQTLEERLLSRLIERANGCLEFAGARQGEYGKISINGKVYKTHRLAWVLSFGDIPEGLLVCHSCDNPPCCNPAHLFLGTVTDNNRDRETKGRGVHLNHHKNKTHCKRGHPFNEDNTITEKGGRRCRTCHYALKRTRYAQRKRQTP